jgi:hypothetical protein
MQRLGGGGNDPTCGCDTQAGWPSPSELPRGGIQGGGTMNFNDFNLALTKNGKTRHLRGKWNAKNSMKKTMRSMKTMMGSNNIRSMMGTNNMMTNMGSTKKMVTSAPPDIEPISYKGKNYFTNRVSGDTFRNGVYVGKYVRPNSGTPYLNSTTVSLNTPVSYGYSNSTPRKSKKSKKSKKGGKRGTRKVRA